MLPPDKQAHLDRAVNRALWIERASYNAVIPYLDLLIGEAERRLSLPACLLEIEPGRAYCLGEIFPALLKRLDRVLRVRYRARLMDTPKYGDLAELLKGIIQNGLTADRLAGLRVLRSGIAVWRPLDPDELAANPAAELADLVTLDQAATVPIAPFNPDLVARAREALDAFRGYPGRWDTTTSLQAILREVELEHAAMPTGVWDVESWSALNDAAAVNLIKEIQEALKGPPPPSVAPADHVTRMRKAHPRASCQIALVEYMSNRETASFDDIAHHVHGDGETTGDAVRSNVKRTNEGLAGLEIAVRFECGASHVVKRADPL